VKLRFIQLRYDPNGSGSQWRRVQIDCENLKVRIESKSALKIQNRSINSVGNDEEDDVDNVPLYGRSYSGKGTGTTIIGGGEQPPSGQSLFGDASTGMILLDGTANLREPMLPYAAIDAKRSAKAKLDPADIKTSVLTDKFTIGVNKLLTLMGNVSGTNPKSRIGKFRVFAFEKMIETVKVDADVVPMTLAYEVNHRLAMEAIGGSSPGQMSFISNTDV